MKYKDLIKKIHLRKQQLGISTENLAKLSGLSTQTITRLLHNKNVKQSTLEAVTTVLGLDLSGNEVIQAEQLRKSRAQAKARYLATLVQGTSTLEMQGLEEEGVQKIIHLFEQELLEGKYQKALWVS